MDRFFHSSELTEILTKTPGNTVIWDCFLSRLAELTSCNTSYLLITDRMRKKNTLDFIQTPSIVEIAENTCRSQDTIRNHMKHILHKMDVHNQAALMKKLVSLTAL